MRTSWWRTKNELDTDQIAFIQLPATGRYALIGPPGSGKTNLLLLRAQYIAGKGEKNVLIITYTKALADFIRTGINSNGFIRSDQVKTFHSWANSHILEHLGQRGITAGAEFNDEKRSEILELIKTANSKIPGRKIYSAIFVDEAQDLTLEELEALLCLSDNVCICGDENQGIYRRDGLKAIHSLGLVVHKLNRHFRIGQRIARAADRLCPPDEGVLGLEATSNYNIRTLGESSANMHICSNVNEQFDKMIGFIRVQLDAFNDDSIGIFCGTKDSIINLKTLFKTTDLADLVIAHGVDEEASFSSDKRIHIMTIHAAKGTEFRCVHIFKAEELKSHPLNRSRLGYTAITRAKTALNIFRTGDTNAPLENAFSVPAHIDIDDLFQVTS
ncbi:AAA family ATPase [Rheinheimera baltica]|uniref:DNA 3'-5' helicase II n=1 Tax=Rheinheimera baltica TaxID=67576 RepID=A0ABT9I4S9_9GAMM|nr:UvrD-helicase domain-containing protein [Rheinheimera baltica]MDP5138093.1 AAA family ATPase [Rheinheimera baltica]